jgi:hypothetical protein
LKECPSPAFVHVPVGVLATEIVLDGRAGSMDIDASPLARSRAGRVLQQPMRSERGQAILDEMAT